MDLKGSIVKVLAASNSDSKGKKVIGKIGEIESIETDYGMRIIFSDETFLRTSPVLSARFDKRTQTIKIKTKNNEYTLEKLEDK